jgi:hypothetical protein
MVKYISVKANAAVCSLHHYDIAFGGSEEKHQIPQSHIPEWPRIAAEPI